MEIDYVSDKVKEALKGFDVSISNVHKTEDETSEVIIKVKERKTKKNKDKA